MNKIERIEARKLFYEADGYEEERAALTKVNIVNMIPTIPDGTIVLCCQLNDQGSIDDYTSMCERLGIGSDYYPRLNSFDGNEISPRKVYHEFTKEGFMVVPVLFSDYE
jgi:hypothetical protein